MTVKYPALKAVLDRHTVETPRGLMSGFLVRCMASRKDLGYVWQAGSAWRWRTPDGQHYGERSTQRAAVQVLRDGHDLSVRNASLPQAEFDARSLPFEEVEGPQPLGPQPQPQPQPKAPQGPQPTAKGGPPRPQPKAPQPQPKAPQAPKAKAQPKAPKPAAEPPVQKIVWTTQAADVTSALAAAFKRQTDK